MTGFLLFKLFFEREQLLIHSLHILL